MYDKRQGNQKTLNLNHTMAEGLGVRSARKTVRWTVFSEEQAAAPGIRKALVAAAAAKLSF